MDYFNKSELKEVEEESVQQISANKEAGEEESSDGEEEDEGEEEEEEEEDDDTGADSEKKLPNKACKNTIFQSRIYYYLSDYLWL